MNHGSGWILFEESFRQRTKKLISILPPWKSFAEIAKLIEQIYIDRYGSIDERLAFKKSRKSAAYTAMTDPYNGTTHCGHDPVLVCIHANKIILRGNELEFLYRIAANRNDPMNPIFEARHQTIIVDR